uniref:translation initiation factor IF-2 N-terminal domain-containing protein n=1 Tax=Arachnia propionica TaxID=1750 RepID=UPI00242EC3A7
MAKPRVHEIAKEIGITSKELLKKLTEMGEYVSSASSTLEAPVVRKVREAFAPKPETPAAKPAAPKPSAAKPAPRPSANRGRTSSGPAATKPVATPGAPTPAVPPTPSESARTAPKPSP